MKDFVSQYLDYVNLEQTECPVSYHRWACLSMIGALLGRKVYLPFGHSKIYPNQYIMLMGSPGTRKGTAMGIVRGLCKAAGYTRFAADKSSKERFLMDMKQHEIDNAATLEELEDLVFDEPSETYILNGEFTDFIGQNNMDFVTMLTNLWDNLNEYVNPKIHGKSVTVREPTVNIFGANTPQGFAMAFPPEAIGNGFLSRVIFVHGEPTGKQIAWPEPADELLQASLAQHLKSMRDTLRGEMLISKEAQALGTKIYKAFHPIDDARFSHYSTRRFTHMLKLAIILAAVDFSQEVKEIHILRANTVLAYAERKMPKALGEFGKNKNSDVANSVMDFLQRSTVPRTGQEIYKVIATDISKITELQDILGNLQKADKIQVVTVRGKQGYLPKHTIAYEWDKSLIDLDWLTPEERM